MAGAAFFDIERGIQIDESVSVIYTPTAAPDTADCRNAGKGSICMSQETGSVWKKITDQGNVGDWVELAHSEYAIKVEHISGTAVILDQVSSLVADQFAWMITAFDELNTANRWSGLVHISHNGSNTTEPTSVKFSKSSVLSHGEKILNLGVNGLLTGNTGDRYMSLQVAAGTPTTFISYRMVKNLASSRAVVLGGGNLDNHIADGSIHLQPYQDALLDAIPNTSQGLVTKEMLTTTENTVASVIASEAQARQLADIALETALQEDIQTLSRSVAYDIASAVVNKPAGNAKILNFAAVRVFTLPADMVGSLFRAGVTSVSNCVFTVYKNDAQIGTVTFSIGQTTASISSTLQQFQVGDLLSIKAPPVQDTKLADITFTIAAKL